MIALRGARSPPWAAGASLALALLLVLGGSGSGGAPSSSSPFAAAAAAAASAAAPLSTPANSSKGKHHSANSCAKTIALDPVAARAPLARTGEKCGPFLAVCAKGLCCSQAGFCGTSSEACGSLCQCTFSGVNSRCKGLYPPPLPKTLPTAKIGAPCGWYVGRCERGACCTELSICAAASSPFCRSAGCQHLASEPDGLCSAAAALRPQRVFEKTLVLSWVKAAPDGFERPFIAINGKFPAENLRVTVGDRLILTVVNNLGVSTALHSHGFAQRRTAPVDGVATVTQRPIPDGESFVYNFVADTPGTFWAHAHQKTQEMDGFRFAIVVEDPAAFAGDGSEPPLYHAAGAGGVQVEDTVTIADLFHDLSAVLMRWYLSPLSGGNEPVPQSAMIDGVAQVPGCGQDGAPACTYRRIKAGPPTLCSSGEPATTLLRVVNVGAMAIFRLYIDGHLLRVVGADSTPILSPAADGGAEPRFYKSVLVNAAQRYDLLVCQEGDGPASTEPVWVRAEMIPGVFYKEPEHPVVLGVMYFDGADAAALPASAPPLAPLARPLLLPELNPQVPAIPTKVFNPQQLSIPAGAQAPQGPADRTLKMVLDFETIKDNTQYAVFNNISFTFSPSSPSLMERYLGTPPGPPAKPNNRKGPVFGFNVQEVKTGDIVDIIINNQDTGEHPIHLHMVDAYWVTAYGMPKAGDYDPAGGPGVILEGRVGRDTETVNLESFLKIRYVAQNKGAIAIMHCHIAEHLGAGLALVIRTV